ncbi:MAG: lipoate-protein ligase A [Mariniblastus sp.]
MTQRLARPTQIFGLARLLGTQSWESKDRTMENARLIVDPPAPGAWNMAVDQAILETADQTGLITLRVYRWSQPTLSLGYFQSHKDRNLHSPSLDCDWVRRRTGGGAIMHDHELTYSLCVPSTHRWSNQNSELYRLVHRILIKIFAKQGAATTLYEDAAPATNHTAKHGLPLPSIDPQSFMCFQRRSPGDIVLDGYKIVGSAQRRLKNALLQHGSVLMKASAHAPGLPGLEELGGCILEIDPTFSEFADTIGQELQINVNHGKLSEVELVAAKNATDAFFGSRSWNEKR